MLIHEKPHPLAGKAVKIKKHCKHSQVPDFGGSEFQVEDWHDRVAGGSWKFMAGNPACIVYALRTVMEKLPLDDEVVYGKIGMFGHLVHISELDIKKKK